MSGDAVPCNLLAPRIAAAPLATGDGASRDGRSHIRLVDPMGLVTMSCVADADPGGMCRDPARLVRASRIAQAPVIVRTDPESHT